MLKGTDPRGGKVAFYCLVFNPGHFLGNRSVEEITIAELHDRACWHSLPLAVIHLGAYSIKHHLRDATEGNP